MNKTIDGVIEVLIESDKYTKALTAVATLVEDISVKYDYDIVDVIGDLTTLLRSVVESHTQFKEDTNV